MEAAQALGHRVWICQAQDLSVIASKAWATLQAVQLNPVTLTGDQWQAPHPWYEIRESQSCALETMDAVFMRKDPPATIAYLYATHILDQVDPNKTLVVNRPQGLRIANEKMYALQFTGAIPATIVSSQKTEILAFVEQAGQAVLKPLGGKAGEGILFLQSGDRNLNSMIEISTHQSQFPVMVQTYLPVAQVGDKRVIVLDGEPIGAVNRVPKGKEFRGNMAVGGQAEQTEITPRERETCQQLAPILRRDGLYFVGLDFIGGYLTEVNVTSPTGIREIDRLSRTNLGQQVMEWVRQKRSI